MNKNYIGKILSEDTMSYNAALRNWNDRLIPGINTVANMYNSLGLKEKFNNDTFKDILLYRIKNIKKAYLDLVNSEIEKVKAVSLTIGSVEDKVNGTLQPLNNAINNIFNLQENASHRIGLPDLPIDFEDIEIKNGQAELKQDQLKKRFQVTIENETESEFYASFLKLQKAWDRSVQIVKNNSNILDRFAFFSERGFIYENNEAKLCLDERMIKML